MCPYYVIARPTGVCGCYGEGLLHPNLQRRKQCCQSKFWGCTYYQSVMKPVFIQSRGETRSEK